ncbi:MAG: DUF2294 family protein [Solirubrobacterales bacterium]|nr:DUF2294 family protein [Solirubrobacterales bacterium]
MASSLEVHRARAGDGGERGRMLGAVTTSIVQLHVDAFGKGPTAARTDLRDGEYVMCVMRDAFTRAESTLVAAGHGDIVRRGREAVYASIELDLCAVVGSGVERPVVGFAPAVTPDLALVTLLFLLGPQI